MIKLSNLIKENSKLTYDYGCVMLYFSFPEINKIHDSINPSHIYTEDGDTTYGLEDEPHTTLLYGLHNEVTLEDVSDVLDNYTYYTCKIHNPSLFENEKYDVLKFDVDGDNLHQTNADLKQFPFTSNYPNYHPHLTIAYLKPGMGKKYVDMLNKAKANEFWLAPQYAVYSEVDGTKTKINIRVD
jgi:2'-5' RNA ligase